MRRARPLRPSSSPARTLAALGAVWTAVHAPSTGLAAQQRAEGGVQAGRTGSVAALRVAAEQEGTLDLEALGPHREEVPTPASFLGYPPGSLHTPHARVVAYLRTLAEAAPGRILVEPYGRSYEGRELVLAFVGAPGVLERRDEIRSALQRLAEPRGVSEAAAADLARRTPVVVWLNHSNDGNESAAEEAAMRVAYHLVAGEGEEVRRLREGALVILNPAHNPESHDRHVAWYNAFGIGAADPAAMEHDAPWGMSTNNNHYQIDLNRDGWALTQRETQALAAEVLRWRPQVFVDLHGQTEQYFFPPPMPPVNPDLPDSHLRWLETFGRGNAEAFDRRGWSYYVRDVFDLHYPGYFDSWPSLHGAIGMTYETDGGGSRGLRWRREDGSVVTFRDGIDHHVVASLATIRTAVRHREALLLDFAAFFRSALERGRSGNPARAFVLEPGDDPRRAAALVATLLRHGVEVRRVEAPFRAPATRHRTGEGGVREFLPGAWLVDLAQPEGRAASTFLRADVPLDSGFVREQLARWSRNARRGKEAPEEDYEFYDITAWSLPLAFGVEAYALAELPEVASVPVTVPSDALAGSGSWEAELPFALAVTGGVVDSVGGVTGEGGRVARPVRARSAYLFEGGTEGALRLLAGLLTEEFRVAVSPGPLMAAGRSFPRGTFVVRVDRNPASLHGRIDALARDAAVPVTAAHTAFPARGPRGTGSGDLIPLTAPRVAVAADEGVSVTSFGAVWFTLERRLGYPFTPLRLDRVRGGALERYDVLVLPGGSAAGYRRGLGEAGLEALRGWVERGGVLVAWEGAAAFAMEEELVGARPVREEAVGEGAVDSLSAPERLAQIDGLPQRAEPRPPATSPTARPGAFQPVPGAVLRAELDLTHWLTLGYGAEELPVLVRGDDLPGLSLEGSNPVVFPTEGPPLTLSGFVWPGNTERLLRGAAHTVVERRGGGRIVLFGVDPLFRLTWRSTARLFANALFVGPGLAGR